MTLVCVERLGAEHPGSIVTVPNLCPVTLAGDPYFVPFGADPTKGVEKTIAVGSTMVYVVPITNPTGAIVPDVRVYLEHVGTIDAAFRQATWNIGAFRPNDIFFAAWTVSARGAAYGTFHASVVALSATHEAVRLSVPLGLRRDDYRM